MLTGQLYQKKDKEIEEDLKKGIDVELGIEINSLMDTITLHEINYPNEPNIIISLLKKEIMLLLGKLEIKENDNKTTNTKSEQ